VTPREQETARRCRTRAGPEEAITAIAANRYQPRVPGGENYPAGLPGIGLIDAERNALRRLLPGANKWPELRRFHERVEAVERELAELGDQSRVVHEQLVKVDRRDADALASWLVEKQGDPPEPEKPRLEKERDRLLREIAARQRVITAILEEKVSYIEKHKGALTKQVDGATREARDRYLAPLRDAEEARQELVDTRAAGLWVRLYPEARESDLRLADSIAGGQRGEMTVNRLEWALRYAAQGWPVFPVDGKEPRTKHGFKDATIDADQIRAWWRVWPDAGIATRTGNGRFVLDIDDEAAVDELPGRLPPTVETLTHDGRHLWFAHPDRLTNSPGGLPGDIHFRGDGGYVVLPPLTPPGWRRVRVADGARRASPGPNAGLAGRTTKTVAQRQRTTHLRGDSPERPQPDVDVICRFDASARHD
jgi:Bifunctional DNA primase/polymerase, N-terminal